MMDWLALQGRVFDALHDRDADSQNECRRTMIYSTTCAYAIRATCRLAALNSSGFARVGEICGGTDLPEYFVSKILRDLVRAGILKSAKGRGGGFGLARPPEQIYLIEIVAAIDGLQPYRQCVVGLSLCNDLQPCPQHDTFKPIRQNIIDYLSDTTLSQMSEALVRKHILIGTPFPAEPDVPLQPAKDAAEGAEADGTKAPSAPQPRKKGARSVPAAGAK